ncbi:hypothetical protein [Helicobacter sp. 23-1045]
MLICHFERVKRAKNLQTSPTPLRRGIKGVGKIKNNPSLQDARSEASATKQSTLSSSLRDFAIRKIVAIYI